MEGYHGEYIVEFAVTSTADWWPQGRVRGGGELGSNVAELIRYTTLADEMGLISDLNCLLFENKADVSVKNGLGCTPLARAIINGHTAVVMPLEL